MGKGSSFSQAVGLKIRDGECVAGTGMVIASPLLTAGQRGDSTLPHLGNGTLASLPMPLEWHPALWGEPSSDYVSGPFLLGGVEHQPAPSRYPWTQQVPSTPALDLKSSLPHMFSPKAFTKHLLGAAISAFQEVPQSQGVAQLS